MKQILWFLLFYSMFAVIETHESLGEDQRQLQVENVFINEIHYDNGSDDVGEFVEVTFPIGTDISSYALVLYRGRTGKVYQKKSMATTVLGDNSQGLSFAYFETPGLRDGNNDGDGIALVNPSGTVLQFLSYESETFVAVNGPARGMTSVDIGVAERGNRQIGSSLQLGGTGCTYSDFAWQSKPLSDTRGKVNVGQTISCSTGSSDGGGGEVLEFVGFAYEDSSIIPLGRCQGDCNLDRHCDIGLSCFERDVGDDGPEGCDGTPLFSRDYCGVPGDGMLVRAAINGVPASAFPLGRCQGHCTSDSDCLPSLSCFVRKGLEPVPGCGSANKLEGIWKSNYCYAGNPSSTSPPAPASKLSPSPTPATRKPTLSPSPNPTPNPGNGKRPSLGYPQRLTYKGACTTSSPCGRCEGDCASNNATCRADLGLVCFSRNGNEPVVGCVTGGPGDVSGVDYCYEAPDSGPVTYVPGDLTVVENGLYLSTGLTSRIIARRNKNVNYDTPKGAQSKDRFHKDPDGAAVYKDPSTAGWIYVSNSEETKNGGVGAITFNPNGDVVGYQRLAESPVTKRNCGGGKTFWNTWLTCEEVPGGQVWEIDPWGRKQPRKTIIGGAVGDKFESAAYDNRIPRNVTFYITADRRDGPLYKFSPDAQAIATALSTDPPNYTDLLHTNTSGTAKVEYLLLSPIASNKNDGTFSWTENKAEAEKNAQKHYMHSEGLDIRDGKVYITTKKQSKLIILDLDSGQYESSSTKSGAFDQKPDQVARLLSGDRSILYFCEDGSKGLMGVHGRDSLGNYYTILETTGLDFTGETSGLAFSPDNKHMYVSFMDPGYIFDITRKDGYPFDGQRLDIKYSPS